MQSKKKHNCFEICVKLSNVNSTVSSRHVRLVLGFDPLHDVCVFSLCMRGFPSGTLVSSQDRLL